MKHPLTSKERRGLVAVAAAALFCIASGFIFRNSSCSGSHAPAIQVREMPAGKDGSGSGDMKSGARQDSLSNSKKERKRKKKSSKKRSPKGYPSRRPLDQPVNQVI